MSARPVIGIICCARRVGEETAQAVMERYLEAVAVHADCAALLVPARSDLMDARDLAGRIDGLLLTEGRERRVGPTLPAPLRVPRRLAVAQEQHGPSLA